MRYVAAYLLAALGGGQPNGENLEKILGSVGIEIDEDRLKQVMSSLSGKNLAEVIEAGTRYWGLNCESRILVSLEFMLLFIL